MRKIDLQVKIAAFCRELDDSTLADLARDNGLEAVYRQAQEALQAGQAPPELEPYLDSLDEMVTRVEGRGLYPSATRSYTPLPPGGGGGSGAQWWTCPCGSCAGRGRVRRGQPPPVCAASGEPLVPRPLQG